MENVIVQRSVPVFLNGFKHYPLKKKNIILYPGSCGGQNKNHNIVALIIYIIQTTIINQIELAFMESGHSIMEVDSIKGYRKCQKKCSNLHNLQD